MALFEKLKEATKSMTDSVGVSSEVGRLKRETAAQEAMITEYKSLLGEYFWNAHLDGTVTDAGADELFGKLQECYDAIAASEREIQRIKEEAQKQKEQREAEKEAARDAKANEGKLLCAACGAYIWPGNKFCPECGAKVELPEPHSSEPALPTVCANCGASYPEGAKFCPECGAPR